MRLRGALGVKRVRWEDSGNEPSESFRFPEVQISPLDNSWQLD